MNDSPSNCCFALTDLLRVRRKLAVREVIYLLDGAARSKFGPGNQISLRTLQVEFGSTEQGQDWIKADVTEWPPFHIRLIRADIEDTDLDRTRIPQSGAASHDATLPRFAGVVYELLGGRHAAFESLRSPLPSLNEEANRTLLEAMRTKSADILPFWNTWLRASECSAPQEVWRVPEWASCKGSEQEEIDLLPQSELQAPIRLSARSQFRIGRSRSLSDIVPHFAENDTEGSEVVSKISRIHVLAELTDSGISLRDGDGTKPTLNGSTFDSIPLSATEPRFITTGGLLKLAGNYELELLLARGPSLAREWQIENVGRMWSNNPIRDFSSLRVRPARGGFARDAIWLFTMAGFRLRSSDTIEWHSHESDGYFIRSGGRFWIANARLDASRIRIDDAGIDHRQIVPLLPGQNLELGKRRFSVATESPEECI